MSNFYVRMHEKQAWEKYKKDHPIKARMWNVFSIIAIGAILFTFLFGGKVFAWWDCGQICKARGHENFYRISQGCYCADESGKPYNPKDER